MKHLKNRQISYQSVRGPLAYGGFLRIFKMLHLSKFFEIFEIHQYFLVKLFNALNFI